MTARALFAHRRPRWLVLGLAGLAAAGGVSIAGLGTALAVERHLDLTLPAPTGPEAVGRTSATWVDASSFDPLAPRGTPREVVVWIWYPASQNASAVTAEYLPAPWRAAIAEQGSTLMAALTRDSAHVHTHSAQDAAVSPTAAAYPVVILRAGGTAEVVGYSTLAEDLASWGYVVVGIDSPYRTSVVVLPDGRIVTRRPENNPERYSGGALRRIGEALTADWSADVAFVLDRLAELNRSEPTGRFTGRLDLTHVGIVGHSFGGATAADFCRQDRRCTAGIDIDGALVGPVIQSGLDRPFLFLMSQLGDFSTDAEVRQIAADIDSVYARLPRDRRAFLSIRGANHFTFSDDGALLKSTLVRRMMRATGVLRIDGRRQLAVTAYAVHRFFDAYLKGTAPVPPRILSPDYPELQAVR